MSNNVFPANLPGLGYTVLKAPEFPVGIQQAQSFSEFRLQEAQNPIWHFELVYDFLYGQPKRSVNLLYTDVQVMMGFFLQQGSSYDSFLFTDPDDLSITNQQLQLVLDTVTSHYLTPLQRNMGGLFLEDITDLNPLNGSGIVIKANGVAKTLGVDFTLGGPGYTGPGFSFGGMYLDWGTSAPAAPITGTLNFYFRVRFLDQKLAFEKWANQWWTLGGEQSSKSDTIKMVTARPPGV